MRRSKQRIAQKRQKKQSHQVVRGTVLVIVIAIVIVGIGLFQMTTPNQVASSDDGQPIWHSMELTNARTGETFTLADFDDRDVVVKITSLF